MSILVTLSTTLRECVANYNPHEGITMPLPKEQTTRSIALALELPLEQIAIIMVNGRHASQEHIVQDGDKIAFFPAIGGG